ncbi:MAG: hypothetical protein JNL58_08395 [Planctomyces sp.]|nr:hypothetical protein [Planctomyces sp.]
MASGFLKSPRRLTVWLGMMLCLSITSGCMTMEDVWPGLRRGHVLRRPNESSGWNRPTHHAPAATWQDPNTNQVPPVPVPVPPSDAHQAPGAGNPTQSIPHTELPVTVTPTTPSETTDAGLQECRQQVGLLQQRLVQLETESSALKQNANLSAATMLTVEESVRRLSREVEYWRTEVRRLEEKAEKTHAEDMKALDQLIELLDSSESTAGSSSVSDEMPGHSSDGDYQDHIAPLPGVDE